MCAQEDSIELGEEGEGEGEEGEAEGGGWSHQTTSQTLQVNETLKPSEPNSYTGQTDALTDEVKTQPA